MNVDIRPAAPRPFRERYRALLWSNAKAPEEVLIHRALVRPGFRMVLAAEDSESLRARSMTEQNLRNVREGFELAVEEVHAPTR